MQNSRLHEEIRLYYEALREEALAASRREKAAILSAHPELAALENQIKEAGFSVLRSALSTPQVQHVHESKMQALWKDKQALLARLELADDYAPVHYHCSYCEDQGYVEGRACPQCFSSAMAALWSRREEVDPLGTASFKDFNLQLFEDNEADPMKSPRRRMQALRLRMEKYVADFGQLRHSHERINLLFNGITGTGKTFLAVCMARALREGGQSVLMLSAPQLFKLYSEYRVLSTSFSPSFQRMENLSLQMEQINYCDFLLIDDLGTEALDIHAAGDFISLLNLRERSAKPILITSNLNLSQIKARYEERIFSRIAGTFQTYSFFGSDLRMPKHSQ